MSSSLFSFSGWLRTFFIVPPGLHAASDRGKKKKVCPAKIFFCSRLPFFVLLHWGFFSDWMKKSTNYFFMKRKARISRSSNFLFPEKCFLLIYYVFSLWFLSRLVLRITRNFFLWLMDGATNESFTFLSHCILEPQPLTTVFKHSFKHKNVPVLLCHSPLTSASSLFPPCLKFSRYSLISELSIEKEKATVLSLAPVQIQSTK